MMNLPGTIQSLLGDISETEVTYGNRIYIKVPVNDDYISLYKSESHDLSRRNLELVLIYSLKKNKPIIFFTHEFEDSFTSSGLEISNRYVSQVLAKVKNSIFEEFEDFSSFIEENTSLLTDSELFEQAKTLYLNNQKPDFELPDEIFEDRADTLDELIKLAEDPAEYAYNLIENYITSHPDLITEYQEFMALNQLIKDCEKTFSLEVILEKKFKQICEDTDYKSLRFEIELGDGEVVEQKVSDYEKNKAYKDYPFYSIIRILHGRTVLYSRDIEDLEKYQLAEDYNFKAFDKFRIYNHAKADFYLSCLSPKLLDSETFISKLCSSSNVYLYKASDRLKADSSFICSLYDACEPSRASYYGALSYIYTNMDNSLKQDEAFCKELLSKYSLKLYKSFCPEIMTNLDIIRYFTDHCTVDELKDLCYSSFVEETLTKGGVIKFFIDCLKERIEKTEEELRIPSTLLKYIEEEDFAFSQVTIGLDYEARFASLNEKFRFNEEFVKKYVETIKKNFDKKYIFTTKTLSILTEKELSNVELMHEILENYDFSNNTYYNNMIPDSVLTEELCLKIGAKEKSFIKYFPREILKKVVLKNPLWFSYSGLNAYYKRYSDTKSDVADLFLELVKTNPMQITYMTSYNAKVALEWVKANIEAYKFIQNCYMLDKDILDYVKDKSFILKILPNKTRYNAHSHPINNKEFVLKQFELAPDCENDDLLGYIPKAMKRVDNFSLLNDKEVVYTAIKINSSNISYLPKESEFLSDTELAKIVVIDNIDNLKYFNSTVRKDEDTMLYIYQHLSKEEDKEILLEMLPKYVQKNLRACL